MVGEQPLHPLKQLIMDREDMIPHTMPYASLGSSSVAISHVVTHSMAGPSTFSPIKYPNHTLGNHLVNPNVFIILCRLSLVGTRVSFIGSVTQVSIISDFYYRLMIHAHVPIHYMENTLPLPTIENLGIEILPFDINII